MLTPRKVSAVPSRGRVPQTPAPFPCTPSPASRGTLLERKTTHHRCTQFQDHLVLETILDFRIILGLEYATASVPHWSAKACVFGGAGGSACQPIFSASLTRAPQKRGHVFAGAYRAANVRERWARWPFSASCSNKKRQCSRSHKASRGDVPLPVASYPVSPGVMALLLRVAAEERADCQADPPAPDARGVVHYVYTRCVTNGTRRRTFGTSGNMTESRLSWRRWYSTTNAASSTRTASTARRKNNAGMPSA